MNIREALKEHGATDQQLSAKVVDLVEEVLAELTDETIKEIGVHRAVVIRNDLIERITELDAAISEFTIATHRYETAQREAWDTYNAVENLVHPLRAFIDAHPKLGEVGDSMKAIATYKGMLEATKDVFGDQLSDEVMSASIEAASYGAWRTIMGEAQPSTTRKRI